MQRCGTTLQLTSKAHGLDPGKSGPTAPQAEGRESWKVFKWEGADLFGEGKRGPLRVGPANNGQKQKMRQKRQRSPDAPEYCWPWEDTGLP